MVRGVVVLHEAEFTSASHLAQFFCSYIPRSQKIEDDTGWLYAALCRRPNGARLLFYEGGLNRYHPKHPNPKHGIILIMGARAIHAALQARRPGELVEQRKISAAAQRPLSTRPRMSSSSTSSEPVEQHELKLVEKGEPGEPSSWWGSRSAGAAPGYKTEGVEHEEEAAAMWAARAPLRRWRRRSRLHHRAMCSTAALLNLYLQPHRGLQVATSGLAGANRTRARSRLEASAHHQQHELGTSEQQSSVSRAGGGSRSAGAAQLYTKTEE
jgi:hypothetical protein